ncbi:MAG: adenine phosphoribosyltransferase [Flavobacteriales bacterium]|nr:adenine phosphoribosyltransferase [Flavobacteriales bacterium]MBK6884496.1 adenine phosphoribosyltransferase [Flavobacteriales bacterium]MBK7100892.1 adenine phosphoribosyltransferase [Flavobacteriales bacterium]MBK7111578.1 adenine phosphoribosyltransferase [Flavobacteriales bacterium]MBK7484063.1 adenine phosphoribosyltransferase [Flavobacteriales bacterium]
MNELENRLRTAIRAVPDFPKPGVLFRDITPVLEDVALSNAAVAGFRQALADHHIDAIAGIESRGFLFGMPLAMTLGIPFVTVRKKGKLPWKTVSYAYDLEYGSAEVEMHVDSVKPGMRVMVHDDLLATGGTAAAAAELIKKQGGVVAAFSFLIELSFLNGMDRLKPYGAEVVRLVTY